MKYLGLVVGLLLAIAYPRHSAIAYPRHEVIAAPVLGSENQVLNDEELAKISARGVVLAPSDNGLGFVFDNVGGPNTTVDGVGSLEFMQGLPLMPESTVVLGDNAQSQVRSLVNINAANAIIQVMLNLNININSTVDSVTQGNYGTLPLALP